MVDTTNIVFHGRHYEYDRNNTCLSTQLVSHDNPNQAHNELYNFEEAAHRKRVNK